MVKKFEGGAPVTQASLYIMRLSPRRSLPTRPSILTSLDDVHAPTHRLCYLSHGWHDAVRQWRRAPRERPNQYAVSRIPSRTPSYPTPSLAVYTVSDSTLETPAAAAAVLLSSDTSIPIVPASTVASSSVTPSISVDDVHNGSALTSRTQSASTASTGVGVVNASVSVPSLKKTYVETSTGTAIAAPTAASATSSAPPHVPSKPSTHNVKQIAWGGALLMSELVTFMAGRRTHNVSLVAFGLIMYIKLRAHLNHSRSSHNSRRGPSTYQAVYEYTYYLTLRRSTQPRLLA
jgi:hypothetical protein